MPGRRASEEERKDQILDAAFRVASRAGLERMTVGDVASEAGLSKGLVFFHFKSKDALLLALLDKLTEWQPTDAELEGSSVSSGLRLVALLRREILLARDEDEATNELLLQYWVMGANRPDLLDRLRAALRQYGEAFLAPAEQVVNGGRKVPPGVTPEGLAALSLALVLGGGLQASLDPEHFDAELPLATLHTLLGGASE